MTTPNFLKDPDKQLLIDGKWVPALSGEKIETSNPATGKLLATLARGRRAGTVWVNRYGWKGSQSTIEAYLCQKAAYINVI